MQRINRNLWWTKRHGRARCGVEHPRRQLSGQPAVGINMQDFSASTSGASKHRDLLSVQRMPPVVDYGDIRSVC